MSIPTAVVSKAARAKVGPVRRNRRKTGTGAAGRLPYFSAGSELPLGHRLQLLQQESSGAIAELQALCKDMLERVTAEREYVTSDAPLELRKNEASLEYGPARDEMYAGKLRTLTRRENDMLGSVSSRMRKLQRGLQTLQIELATHARTMVRDHDLEKMQIMRENDQRSKINMHWSNGLITTPHEARVWKRSAELEKLATTGTEKRQSKPET